MLKHLVFKQLEHLDGNRFLSLSVLPYYTSLAEVSTAAEEMEKLASEVVSILTLLS